MWIAKIRYESFRLGILGKLAKENNVSVVGYPISYSKTEKGVISFVVGTLFGERKNKGSFVRAAKKSPLFLNVEEKDDFLTGVLKIVPEGEPLYNPYIIYAKPAIISPDGMEILEIASFEKKHLEKVISFLEKVTNAKLISMIQEKISGLSVATIAPKITMKQRGAFELALNNGYYNYPRKIDLKRLAKISGINFSAYHAHLRKAEKALLPYAYKILS